MCIRDSRKIIKLGPKMLGGFFAASVSISLAFIATFAIMKGDVYKRQRWT